MRRFYVGDKSQTTEEGLKNYVNICLYTSVKRMYYPGLVCITLNQNVNRKINKCPVNNSRVLVLTVFRDRSA